MAASDIATDVMTTVLEPSEVLSSIRIPRLSDSATWGHYKVCIKPGDFADSLAVVVLDRKRERCRAVIAGRTSPPAHLDGVAQLVESASGWSGSLQDEIKETTDADFRAASFGDETDRYATNLHRTAIIRAAKEALSS